MATDDVLEAIGNGITGVFTEVKDFFGSPIGAATGGAIIGSVATGAVVSTLTANGVKASSSTRKKKKKSRKNKRHPRHQRIHQHYGYKEVKSRRGRKHRKHRKKSHSSRRRKGVHYTKNGQPYVLLRNGKARFIKGRRR
jgi:hypothetical protein